jgi:crotonobetainyl-CoA:carnitine CoA-transferase CaiB-like acyl-CoA transferase
MTLEGVTVVELASGIGGPLAGLRLGDLGAAVTKVERDPGDWLRQAAPTVEGTTDSATFVALNRGKRSLGLGDNLQAAAAVLTALVSTADVVISDWDEDAMEAGGLSDAQARADKGDSAQVWLNLSSYGVAGPWVGRPGSELIVQGATGYTRYLGEGRGRPVSRLGADVAGCATGIFAVEAALAALLWRRRGGTGQTVGLSAMNSLLSMKSIHLAAQSDPDDYQGPRIGGPHYEVERGWKTADRPITFSFGGSVGEHGRPGWVNFVAEVGLGWMLEDDRFKDDPTGRLTTGLGVLAPELRGEYEKEFVKHSSEELVTLIRKHGGAAAVFQDHQGVVDHEQTAALGILHAGGEGGGPRQFTGFPARFSETEVSHTGRVPRYSEHTEEVCRELGLDPFEVRTLLEKGGLVSGEARTS